MLQFDFTADGRDSAASKTQEVAELRLLVPGRLVSNNLVIRHVGKIALKSREAREDQARVESIARASALAIGWVPIAADAEVTIIAWNCRCDVDNIGKCPLDGMRGIAYTDDRVITRLIVEKRKDKLGDRYEIVVRQRV